MKTKTFFFINQYSSTPEISMGGRHYYLAQELAKKGHKVYVIAGSYSHLLRCPKIFEGDFLVEHIEENFNFVWVKLPEYSGAHSKERIINEFRFSWKIRNLKKIITDRPDVIIHSSPALIAYFGAVNLANYFKVPFVFEVRDLWPLTLIEVGGYSKNHPFIRFLQWTEDKAYQRADFIFSNFFNAIEHMYSRGVSKEKFHWIPNGVSLEEVENKELLCESVMTQIPKNKFIVGYTGTIGTANAMNYLIDAAEILQEKEDIHFLLVGDGKEKNNLRKIIKDKSLNNITFIDSIAKKEIQSMLEIFDVCYIGWHKNKMYRFGVAANKIPEYLYSERPVVHSFSGAGDLIKQANAGVSVDAEDPVAIAKAIQQLYQLNVQERQILGRNGRNFVLNELSYVQLSEKLERIIFGSEGGERNEALT